MNTASILLEAGFCVSIMFLFRPRNVPRGRLHRTVEVGVARMSSGSDAREPGGVEQGGRSFPLRAAYTARPMVPRYQNRPERAAAAQRVD